MQVDEQFDYEKYIQERLREVDDLEERKFAKKLLLEGLGRIFATIDDKYYQLERRILNEVEVEHNHYEVATTVVAKDQYDPLSEFLFPMSLEDVEKSVASSRFTVYLEAEDQLCREFIKERSLVGRLKTDDTVVRFRVERCARYQETLNSLYQLFYGNQIIWTPIHKGYLERFFDIVVEIGDGADDDETPPLEFEKEDMEMEWGRWLPYIRNDMMLLWNIKTDYYKVSSFMIPCLDDIHYECVINILDESGKGYLFEVGEDIDKIIYEKGRVIVQAFTDQIKKIKLYITHNYEGQASYNYDYPIFDNRSKGSFCGRYLTKTGVFLQTPAELYRKIEDCSGIYQVAVTHYDLVERIPAGALFADMNEETTESVFPIEKRRILLIYFKKSFRSGCYYDSQIRYILTRLQQEYMDYRCVGVYE
ncbi:MAG: hypothetical protein LBV33_05440 [Lachnospiraceae bacterium]|jgi:hypothetical protein|nr:hypothetical protein [Lachnospiraceae bacterium]